MSEPHPEIGAGPARNSAADQGRQLAHAREAERVQADLILHMTPGRRLQIARELYETAWQLKEAGLRRQHPEWTAEAIHAKCRRVFVTGYAGA
jgi:hypothetical protein